MVKPPPVKPPKNPEDVLSFPQSRCHIQRFMLANPVCTILHLHISYVNPPSGNPKIPGQKYALSLHGAATLALQLKAALHEFGHHPEDFA